MILSRIVLIQNKVFQVNIYLIMYQNTKIVVIIPALNEEKSLPYVLNDIPDFVDNVIVADNGSTDNTAGIAIKKGAEVVFESNKGYGNACLAGIRLLKEKNPDIVVFLDADYADNPTQMNLLLNPIVNSGYDLVLGARNLKQKNKKGLLFHARFGNWLATSLMYLKFGYKYYDLGPFRALKYESLKQMNMIDKNFGWTIEMQIKAIRNNLKVKEVSVDYRERIGQSKISGTFIGSAKAGVKIIYTIMKYTFQ